MGAAVASVCVVLSFLCKMGMCCMSRLYGPLHRSLQDRFDTRRLADNVEARVVLAENAALMRPVA